MHALCRWVPGASFLFLYKVDTIGENPCVRPLLEDIIMRIFWVAHFMVFLFLSPVFAEIDVAVVSESIVQVRAYKNNRIIAAGSGFVVNKEGYVLTNAHLLADADGLTVLAFKTGVEVVSQQVFASRELNLALLRVQGLGLPLLNLSEQGADVGRIVQILKLTPQDSIQIARGTIGAYQDVPGKKVSDPVAHLLQHNAIVTSKAFGMPLFNECGDVVAINLPDPDSGRWPFRKAEPKGIIFALRSSDIITVLKDLEIAYSLVEEECLSAVERAERDRKIAEDRIKAAQDSAQAIAKVARDSARAERAARLAAERAVRAKQQEAEKAKARADSASKAAIDSINTARLALEREKAKTDSLKKATQERIAAQKAADSLAVVHQEEREKTSQRLQWAIVSGGAVVILVLLGWFIFARSKKAQLQSAASRLSEAEHEAEAARQAVAEAPQPAPFKCLLEGQDNTGQPFALSISALALGAPSGATLGRSPANAEFIIDHEAVSREHIRLFYTNEHLYTEDLNTLNGTKINGRLLNPHEPVVLENNDQLELGPVVFQVRLMQE